MRSLLTNRSGIAWVPVLIAAFLGSGAVIGGSVVIGDAQNRSAARQAAQPEEARQVLHEQLDEFFNMYRRNCFSLVTSLGNRQRFHQALDDVILSFNADRTGSALAIAQSGTLYTNQRVEDYDLSDGPTVRDLRTTLWHELIHVIEVDNGDRRSGYNFIPFYDTSPRNERHAEYGESMIGILDNLIRIERRVHEGAMTAEQARTQLEALRSRWGEGSANTFESTPSDLSTFESYSGFRVNVDDILKQYESGTCIMFPDGTFEEVAQQPTGQPSIEERPATDTNVAQESSEDERYVVWISTNTNAGIAITTKERYETDELAMSYSGGGNDPVKIMEKRLLSGGKTFSAFKDAEAWICPKLEDIHYAPLGVGWGGDWEGKFTPLVNTQCDGWQRGQ